MSQTEVVGSWRKVTLKGLRLWMERDAEETGNSPLAMRHQVSELTGELDFRQCFDEDSFAHVYFDGRGVMQYGTRIASAKDIVEGWPTEEEA